MYHPRVILLDEPVAGLNISETDEMSDLILKQKNQASPLFWWNMI
jgi:ABC-type branched-subunit amino acid transport system ATPase component